MHNRMVVDTNVLLRIATGQPEDMANTAKQFFLHVSTQNIKLIVPTLVVAECCWVLKGVYKFDRHLIRDGMKKIFSLPFIELEDRSILKVLDDYTDKNVDLIDAYIANRAKGMPVVTWNRKHFKRLPCEFYSPEEMIKDEKE